MNFDPQTYEELIRMKRCVELTKYYELTEEELEEIYRFLEQNPEASVKGGRQNLALIRGQDTRNAQVIIANCIDSSIDGILMSQTVFKVIPHYVPSSGSAGSGGSSSNNNNNNNNNNNDIIITQSSIEMSNNETTSAADTESTTSAVTESTTSSTTSAAQVSGGVARITTKAEIQEYTSRSNYDDAVFFGDMIVSGIGEYGYLDTSRIFSDNNLTTDKALNSVSSVAAANPSKVYVLVGLNDLNYGTRSGENVAERIGSIVESLKEAIPSVKVYVVSLLPITQSFEAKSNVKITQAAIDEANSTLAARATEYGMTFIDIADAFKDESGYLNTDVSTGGYNLNHNYYPFFLNNISGASN